MSPEPPLLSKKSTSISCDVRKFNFKYSHPHLELMGSGLQNEEKQTYILFGTKRTKPAENAGVSSLSLKLKNEDPDILFYFFHLLLFPLFDFFLLLISPSTGGLPLAAFNLGKVRPYQRGFFCNDDSIKYPFHHSTVTSTVLYTVGFSLPISCVSRSHSRAIWHGANMLTCWSQVCWGLSSSLMPYFICSPTWKAAIVIPISYSSYQLFLWAPS